MFSNRLSGLQVLKGMHLPCCDGIVMKAPSSLEKGNRPSTEYPFSLFPSFGCFLKTSFIYLMLFTYQEVDGHFGNWPVANSDRQSSCCCYF